MTQEGEDAMLTDKVVTMRPADYRAAADEAVEHAIGWLAQDPDGIGRAARLVHAAECLRAADTLNAHAANMENFGPALEEALVEE